MILPSELNSMHERLKYVREVALGDISVREMADLLTQSQGLSITHASVQRYEVDRRPDLDYVEALARVSGVPMDWIVLNRVHGEAGYVIERMERLLAQLRDGNGDRVAV